ncbi:MAG TPA: flagellar biosynthesis protein FlhA [Nitrospirota bacterium]|nr:flagellar biosynthesis protein FlhA [Nitrospirota bacterium]
MAFIATLQQRGDVIVSVSVVSILGVMILPVPAFVLDILLSFSISLAVVILVSAVTIKRPLDLSAFPSILLMTTLYRLSLNIASTRLVLLKGNEGVDAAGQVIKSFGNFVVGGNFAVGFIVFIILVIINFVVITKGSGRIAEVAARFALDAMPGKQMAVDADLNAGLIDEATARKRRQLVAQEADFYGAMDGASKFVRGDAIAGVLITFINIIGGFTIGTLQKGMPMAEAAKTYTILTIGDGLVAQIPALLVSTAAGIVVSRAGTESDIGKDITRQLFINPKVMLTAGGIMAFLGMVPGLPHVPFFLLSAASGGLAYALAQTAAEEKKEELQKAEAAPPQEPAIETFIELEPLTFEIGYGLIPLVDAGRPELLNKIKAMRRQLASDLGFVVPSIHIKDNLQLRPHEYTLMIRGIEVARSEVMIGHHLAVPSGGAQRIEGVPTKEPAFGMPAFWIQERDVEQAQTRGYMVVNTATAIVTHLTEVIKSHAWELLTRNEVQSLLDSVSKNYPKLVDELIPSNLTLGGLQRVLQNLLKERVPINDLITILETLLDYAASTKDAEVLTEFVRQSLARYITKQYTLSDGGVHVLTLDPRFERALIQAMEAGGAINPDVVTKLMRTIETAMAGDRMRGMQPIILCSTQARRFLRKIVERFLPAIVVLSNAELAPTARLYTTGVLKYED